MVRKSAMIVSLLLVCFLLSGFAGPAQAAGEPEGTPWWVWVLIVAVLLFAFLLWWLWWSRRGEEQAPPAAEPRPVEPNQALPASAPKREPDLALPASAPARAAEVVPPQPDDLKIIEGIGPKIAGLLKAAGITTFAQLAEADLGRVQEILTAANLRLADPTTWAEQARLAAAGDWAALQDLQNRLKGGRRL